MPRHGGSIQCCCERLRDTLSDWTFQCAQGRDQSYQTTVGQSLEPLKASPANCRGATVSDKPVINIFTAIQCLLFAFRVLKRKKCWRTNSIQFERYERPIRRNLTRFGHERVSQMEESVSLDVSSSHVQSTCPGGVPGRESIRLAEKGLVMLEL